MLFLLDFIHLLCLSVFLMTKTEKKPTRESCVACKNKQPNKQTYIYQVDERKKAKNMN